MHTGIPSSLIRSVARGECVFFLGAGVSKNALSADAESPPGWVDLLRELLDENFPRSEVTRRRSGTPKVIDQYIKSGHLLDAAQMLEEECEEKGLESEFRRSIAQKVTKDKSGNKFLPGDVHSILGDLFPRIIVTTNYDGLLEAQFGEGYAERTYSSKNVADDIRQGTEVIIKLHGSAKSSHELIITRLDFVSLRSEGREVLELLEALLLTRTVLFLGYSLEDPDLQLLLENQFGSKGALPGHYLVAQEKECTKSRRRLLKNAYGIEMLPYRGRNPEGFSEYLGNLLAEVEVERQSGFTAAL